MHSRYKTLYIVAQSQPIVCVHTHIYRHTRDF